MYERQTNVKQLSIDNLPYRQSVNSRKVYYDKPASRKCKCMHITQDYHDKAKHLKTMDLKKLNSNEIKIFYYLDINNKEVRKLKEYIRKNKTIISSLVYYGTKSKAIRKLNNLLSA